VLLVNKEFWSGIIITTALIISLPFVSNSWIRISISSLIVLNGFWLKADAEELQKERYIREDSEDLLLTQKNNSDFISGLASQPTLAILAGSDDSKLIDSIFEEI
jgi:hypothetical protein